MNHHSPRTQLATSEQIDISTLWRAIWNARLKLIVAAIVIGGATFLGLSLLTPQFTSETQILIGGRGLSDRFHEPADGGKSGLSRARNVDAETVASQVRILLSHDLAEQAAATLRLYDDPEFNKSLAPPGMLDNIKSWIGLRSNIVPLHKALAEQKVLTSYFKALEVLPVRKSRVISVRFTSSDQFRAAEAANQLAEHYIGWLRTESVNRTKDTSAWLRTEINGLRKKVEKAEADIERYRASAGLLLGGKEQVTLNAQQLSELNTELSRVQAAHANARVRAEEIQKLLKRGYADASPEARRSPIIQRHIAVRRRIERQIAQASSDLLAGHPIRRRLQADLATTNRQINLEIRKLVSSLKSEAHVLKLREGAIDQRLQTIKARIAVSGDKAVRLKALERDALSKRTTLETYLVRLSDADARRQPASVPPVAKIISRASPALNPSFPRKIPMTLLAIIATLLMGLFFVLAREIFAPARRYIAIDTSKAPQPEYDPRLSHISANMRRRGRILATAPAMSRQTNGPVP